ncbi:hypothetical protein [Nonomuraea aridisoli]|uniref:Uncharacterized protein n=1 Tax=Nonomuraea aridisoli TaxID=2070368 RepID=A0A2W2EC31_9ACTN|nr:hypothetical protein [Nonomuraea aridisoli]PZG21742.1 hypothetical protein C1J01_05665 [Nonomuraea aridisoli]
MPTITLRPMMRYLGDRRVGVAVLGGEHGRLAFEGVPYLVQVGEGEPAGAQEQVEGERRPSGLMPSSR